MNVKETDLNTFFDWLKQEKGIFEISIDEAVAYYDEFTEDSPDYNEV